MLAPRRSAPTWALAPSVRKSTRCGCWASTQFNGSWSPGCWRPHWLRCCSTAWCAPLACPAAAFSVFLQGVNPGAFINGLTVLTGLRELILAEIKALLFGVMAGLVGCYRGLTVKGGPKGVGNAVNETVVYAFICLFVINVVMTAIGVRISAQ